MHCPKERLPVALAPDIEYDKDGCFSGSAVETPDGKQVAATIIYTPRHCDGISFEAEGNVLMDVEKYDLTFDKE